MHEFDYFKPPNVEAALKAATEADDPSFLSGGMTLLPTMKQRLAAPSTLVDVTGIESLRGIEPRGEQGLWIGAATTHFEVSASEVVSGFCSAVGTLAGGIGDPAVRHRGTIGGSVANNDPAADYPALILGMNAIVETSKRTIRGDEFFVGMFETALTDGEMITGFEFERPNRASYAKFPNPASRYAVVGVFVAEFANGSVRVAVTGAGSDGVFRWHAAEEALVDEFSERSVQNCPMEDVDMMSDIHAAADYRAALIRVMARRAIINTVRPKG